MPIKPRTYWDIVPTPYQMGEQAHRVYLLDLLKSKGVNSILDIGCGTGPIYDMIQTSDRWSFDYKGVDYSDNFMKWARKKFGRMFEKQDMRDLKEDNNSFDCVLLLHSLDHVKEYDKVIKEAARVARKYVCIVLWRAFRTDGLVVVNDRNMYSKSEGDEPWKDTYLTQYSREVLEEEFKKNGLKVDEIAEGEVLISEKCKYGFLYLLKK